MISRKETYVLPKFGVAEVGVYEPSPGLQELDTQQRQTTQIRLLQCYSSRYAASTAADCRAAGRADGVVEEGGGVNASEAKGKRTSSAATCQWLTIARMAAKISEHQRGSWLAEAQGTSGVGGWLSLMTWSVTSGVLMRTVTSPSHADARSDGNLTETVCLLQLAFAPGMGVSCK
ncbi:hypothetical protein GALMADRAFT_1217317 [Galerina marginata CBS 339.88]|uniref:Uncharacterized protein n=1 Tax=Galerina marginata (strain CBS 339.88) TaxID=685588 RepID=A0A067S4X2_GALM3|nr:hypothetical protein GALMADRAFT_1217317 [Galerina marginata CBS 339.88]